MLRKFKRLPDKVIDCWGIVENYSRVGFCTGGPDFIRLCRRRGRVDEDGHWSPVRQRQTESKIERKIDWNREGERDWGREEAWVWVGMGVGEGWKKVLQDACMSWMLFLMKWHREFDAGKFSHERERLKQKREGWARLWGGEGGHSSVITMHCRSAPTKRRPLAQLWIIYAVDWTDRCTEGWK